MLKSDMLFLNFNIINFINNQLNSIQKSLYFNLIKNNRYIYIIEGLKNTMVITLCATLIGIFLGLIVALIRTTYDNTKRLVIPNAICQFYITVIRGTPILIQLMLLYFCIFTSRDFNKIFVAILGFGINSGAYVSEVFRSGLMSIDSGQMEAGRSLGLSYLDTMRYIIIPQAVKVILPTLGNEFIVLIKETSVAGYIAVQDLTKAGDIIRSQTYDAWTPLLLVAGIYLFLTFIFSTLVKKIEKSLRKNERKSH